MSVLWLAVVGRYANQTAFSVPVIGGDVKTLHKIFFFPLNPPPTSEYQGRSNTFRGLQRNNLFLEHLFTSLFYEGNALAFSSHINHAQ